MKNRSIIIPLSLLLLLLLTGVVLADDLPVYNFGSPIFGLAAAPDGSLLVAEVGAGIVELRNGEGSVAVELPGAADAAPIGRGSMFAITGLGDNDLAQKLYHASRGRVREIADLGEFEDNVNPDGGEIDSNPYGVAVLSGGQVLVADAGGNSLLIADRSGNLDWVATLPEEPLATANIKALAGCPESGAGFCFLPPALPDGEAVPTSVAVGPDGAYYVGELKGFPAPAGESQVWRIEPGTLHAECGTDPACSVVLDGFTSIVDLDFGPDGTLYVVELDEASWAAVEIFGTPTGGTVNACDVSSGSCTEAASGLNIPTAVAVDKQNNLYAAVDALLPTAQVVHLP